MIRIDTIDGRRLAKGSPLDAAVWLVARYGEHADAQGLSGPAGEVTEAYRLIDQLIEDDR
jgi:hypothetical protein